MYEGYLNSLGPQHEDCRSLNQNSPIFIEVLPSPCLGWKLFRQPSICFKLIHPVQYGNFVEQCLLVNKI